MAATAAALAGLNACAGVLDIRADFGGVVSASLLGQALAGRHIRPQRAERMSAALSSAPPSNEFAQADFQKLQMPRRL
ncbi:hypothetical protein DLM46_24000 [Paraburkholderia lacunae]|uniref:Uncharacterized protein n=1 Tax=Paraburkholderia lacunae TaxID=2211104 RepID=A0A370N426_9BURK|nr:hypothetical protein DLM46_24000 [Paraburkholderia lacunae]